MTIETERAAFPVRYEDPWEAVDAASGQLTRRFGTVAWTPSGIGYQIRNGFAVAICAAEIDTEPGISYGVDVQVRGPEDGRLAAEGLTGIGFGYVSAPKVPPECLPAVSTPETDTADGRLTPCGN